MIQKLAHHQSGIFPYSSRSFHRSVMASLRPIQRVSALLQQLLDLIKNGVRVGDIGNGTNPIIQLDTLRFHLLVILFCFLCGNRASPQDRNKKNESTD
jgi:hypothetical protein